MLLDTEVSISWNNATKRWYEEKGYVYTKIGDKLIISVEDIINTSTVRVNVKCDYCGKEHTKEYRNYISGRTVVEKDCCSSKKCLAKKTKEINIKLYGVESCMQREEVKNKVSESMRMSFDDVLSLCSKKGLNLLSESDEYKNDRSRIKIICKNHIEKGIQETTLANIKKSKHCCFYGGAESTGKNKRIDFDVVVNKFLELGHTPLFTKEDYKGNYSKLKFICNKHIDKGHQFTRYAIIQQGSCGCNYCVKEEASNKLRLDQDFIFKEFERRGLKIVEGQVYSNKDQKIKYICMKHPNIIQHSTYNNLKKVDIPCDLCRHEQSISDINKRFRSSITRWKNESEIKSNYKCIFTQSKTYDIHHIYPYNEIVKEAFNRLNIDKNTTDGLEIEKVKNEIVRLHEHYGLGVCIHPEIHKLFHSIYGKLTSKKDFEEFKENYINGLYRDKIDIKDMS